MRLRPGLPVLWRGPTEVQVGTDPRWAVTLSDLSPSAAMALHAAPTGADVKKLRSLLAHEHVGAEETAQVLDHLVSAHLLVDGLPGESAPDTVAWGIVAADAAGRSVLAARQRSSVRVVGLGRVGTALAGLLAGAGVGTVELEDPGLVDPRDVGACGLLPRDVGAPRVAAAARVLHDIAPGVRTTRGHRPVDLVVLVEDDVADPVAYAPLLEDDVSHLSVVIREASVLVGPLVQPGRSACLRCADLHRTDLDPQWPAVATQLASRDARRVVETALAAVSSALAAVQVLAHLDGRPTAVRDASLELRLPDCLPRTLRWPPHRRCDCAGPPAEAGELPA